MRRALLAWRIVGILTASAKLYAGSMYRPDRTPNVIAIRQNAD